MHTEKNGLTVCSLKTYIRHIRRLHYAAFQQMSLQNCAELMNSVYYSGMQGHLQEGKQRQKTENIKNRRH